MFIIWDIGWCREGVYCCCEGMINTRGHLNPGDLGKIPLDPLYEIMLNDNCSVAIGFPGDIGVVRGGWSAAHWLRDVSAALAVNPVTGWEQNGHQETEKCVLEIGQCADRSGGERTRYGHSDWLDSPR